jgi:hypothetical protein
VTQPKLDESSLWGVWTLKRWRRIEPNGDESMPHTVNGCGRIIYERSGKMAAFLMHPDWPATGAVTTPPAFTAYSGAYKVVGDEVHHLCDFASNPAMIGQTLVRKASWKDGMIVLKVAATDDASATQVLEWAREDN